MFLFFPQISTYKALSMRATRHDSSGVLRESCQKKTQEVNS